MNNNIEPSVKRRCSKNTKQLCQHLYESIYNIKKTDGTRICDLLWSSTMAEQQQLSFYRSEPENPIDLVQIQLKLKINAYADINELVQDLELLVNKARAFYDSQTEHFQNATYLWQYIQAYKNSILHDEDDEEQPQITEAVEVDNISACAQFLDAVMTVMDESVHAIPLQQMFQLFSEYLPIDLNYITNNLHNNGYANLAQMERDLLQMTENACQLAAQVYANAKLLESFIKQKRIELEQQPAAVPEQPHEKKLNFDASYVVQELFLQLFDCLSKHEDENGHCYADSLNVLPEYDDRVDDTGKTIKVRGTSFDLIKRRLRKGVYKRLDALQADVFLCLERARELSHTDSDVFHNAIELQTLYLQKRDELCKDTLSSPALNYTIENLLTEVEVLRKLKLVEEQQAQQQQQQQEIKDEFVAAGMQSTDFLFFKDNVYSPGEFVYVQLPNEKLTNIAYIERLWRTADDVGMLRGVVFLHPEQTCHAATRKFFKHEVFMNSRAQTILMDNIRGKCIVMHINDYAKLQPVGFESENVYVCEYIYNAAGRYFKKLQNWAFNQDDYAVKCTPRKNTLRLQRILSSSPTHTKNQMKELQEQQLEEEELLENLQNVPCVAPVNAVANTIYYQQYNTSCSGIIRTGDFVYVASDYAMRSIAQIHQIWETGDNCYFSGTWLLRPCGFDPPLDKESYQQELLLSTSKVIMPIAAIESACAVLEYTDYISWRPTEIAENDVYICEYMYDGARQLLCAISDVGGLLKFQHSAEVKQNEIFYFRTPIKLCMEPKNVAQNELVFEVEDLTNEDVTILSDDSNAAVTILEEQPASCSSSKKTSTKEYKNNKNFKYTGYLIYSMAVRKEFCANNPTLGFGDISRLVGNEWKKMPLIEKKVWLAKANEMNNTN